MLPIGCGIEWYIELKLEWVNGSLEAAAEAAIAEVAAAADAERADGVETAGMAPAGEAGGAGAEAGVEGESAERG